MSYPRIQEYGERSVYTCMLWNVQSGRPTVVTIHEEHHDRWIGRRCMVAATSFEAPLEMFMKSDWRRAEVPEPKEPVEVAPAPAAGNGSRRGFHP